MSAFLMEAQILTSSLNKIKIMKKFIATVLLVLCFGFAKTHMPSKIHPAFTQKKFVVTGINRLENYNVIFKVNRNIVFAAINKNKVETNVNTFGVEVSQTKMAVTSIGKDRNGFARRIYFL